MSQYEISLISRTFCLLRMNNNSLHMGLGSKLWMSHNKNTNFETLTLIDEDTIIVINGESDKNIEI